MPRLSAASLRRPSRSDDASDLLVDLTSTFVNPGALRMRMFVPPGLAANAPLVVVLHGCTQTAAGYDRGAGWSAVAARLGFALLFPEQIRANNANACFNWFEPGDTRRGGGEAASIAGAVTAMVAAYRLDAARVFITGLSSGGAMANVMLATYPDVFAGGAIIAGLPYGTAHGVAEALTTMAHPVPVAPHGLGDHVRAASTHSGPWPVVSIWHGSSDRTVAMANGEAIAVQWADVHGATTDTNGRQWRNAAGIPVVEFHRIDGMGHGTPIDAAADGCTPAPFMLNNGIDSTAEIAAFWGLGTVQTRQRARSGSSPPRADRNAKVHASLKAASRGGFDVTRLINDTLRSAGLMK